MSSYPAQLAQSIPNTLSQVYNATRHTMAATPEYVASGMPAEERALNAAYAEIERYRGRVPDSTIRTTIEQVDIWKNRLAGLVTQTVNAGYAAVDAGFLRVSVQEGRRVFTEIVVPGLFTPTVMDATPTLASAAPVKASVMPAPITPEQQRQAEWDALVRRVGAGTGVAGIAAVRGIRGLAGVRGLGVLPLIPIVLAVVIAIGAASILCRFLPYDAWSDALATYKNKRALAEAALQQMRTTGTLPAGSAPAFSPDPSVSSSSTLTSGIVGAGLAIAALAAGLFVLNKFTK